MHFKMPLSIQGPFAILVIGLGIGLAIAILELVVGTKLQKENVSDI